jgi:hypothetical protein
MLAERPREISRIIQANLAGDFFDLGGGRQQEILRPLQAAALLRNLKIARELGCLDYAGLSEMRQGKAPTIKNGPYAGDQLSVDHIIPRKVCKELDNVIANLELMPERINSAKGSRVGVRQVSLARLLNKAGLLSAGGLKKVEGAEKR